MMKVKICGITNLEDARIACAAGADMLGFNFYRRSPRCVSVQTAKEIIGAVGADARNVGVFVDEEIERMIEIVRALRLDAVQLHGDETPALAKELRTRAGCAIIKAFRVSGAFDVDEVLNYPADEILLDAYSPRERGGTGETFDWNIAKNVATSVRLVLAGGLSVENVAMAIQQVGPYAVDACSRIESSPGKKDTNKMRMFIEEARK